jgi:hypothetical protein
MTENDYLGNILFQQILSTDSQEFKDLQERGSSVKTLLGKKFGSARIREAGSKKKGTMIKASYDLDITCYFPHDDTSAGESLKEIYQNVGISIREEHVTIPKGSAIRVCDATGKADFHIDVVPGRFVDGDKGDVFLYISSGEKERLKTNLDIHIAYVRDSGVRDAIRLMKFWRELNGIQIKTFTLELLVIKLLKEKKDKALSEQLLHVWEQFKSNGKNLTIEDPANPNGNDLSELLNNGVLLQLFTAACFTLETIEKDGWQKVFGEVESDEEQRVKALKRVSVTTEHRSKPWSSI